MKYRGKNLLESRNFLLVFCLKKIQRDLNWGMTNLMIKPKAAKYKALAEIKKVREHLDHYENMIHRLYNED